jgi:hypothetical protein
MTAPHVGAQRALAGAADGAVRAHQHRVNVQMPRADVLANVVLLAHIVAGWTIFKKLSIHSTVFITVLQI